jgi:hypothetical protein
MSNGTQERKNWGYSVMPAYANVGNCQVTRFWYTTDNSLNVTANFTVQAVYEQSGLGVELSFKAIRSP